MNFLRSVFYHLVSVHTVTCSAEDMHTKFSLYSQMQIFHLKSSPSFLNANEDGSFRESQMVKLGDRELKKRVSERDQPKIAHRA